MTKPQPLTRRRELLGTADRLAAAEQENKALKTDIGSIRLGSTALRREIADLREDKARLDWMQANPRGCAIRHAPNEWGVTDTEMLGKNHRGATLREAIDAARKTE